jgi:hypothetical protein
MVESEAPRRYREEESMTGSMQEAMKSVERAAFRSLPECPVVNANGKPKRSFVDEQEATEWEKQNRAK